MARGAMNRCYITIVGFYKDHQKVGGWIRNLDGHLESRITDDTTHLVVSEKSWRDQAAMVKEALDLNEDERRGIKIVSYDWLEDSIVNKTKKREGAYLWERLDRGPLQRWKKARKEEGKEVGDEKMGHMGLIAEMFHESTDPYLDEKEKEKIDKVIRKERKAREEMAAEDRAEEAEKKKQANSFAKGAKKARDHTMSLNHHIYTDDTGFKYDILLTKVDTKHNRNERYALTIYESNAAPHTYAVNSQFAGTGRLPAKNVLSAVGSGWPTAFRAFKKTFKEHTRVEWDERVSFALESAKREKRDRGRATGSPDWTQKGVPASKTGLNGGNGVKVGDEEDFRTVPFQYHLPQYGAVGAVPEEEKEKLAGREQQGKHGGGRGKIAGGHDRVDLWMSGANGTGPGLGTAPKTPTMSESGTPQIPCTPKAVNPRTQQDQDDEFEGVVDGMMGDMYGGAGLPYESQNLNEVFGDYAFEPQMDCDFDFDGAITGAGPQDSVIDGAEPRTSFNIAGGFEDSFFELGTQIVGETQIAERVQGELMDYIDHPLPTSYVNGAEVSNDIPAYNLGASMLGKRKASPIHEIEQPSKMMALGEEVADSFDEESYRFDSGAVGGNQVPRVFVEEEENAKAEEQLQFEAQNAGGSGIEIEL